jgi:hypothetical protein
MKNNDLQNIHIKLKMNLYEHLQKPGDELMSSGMVSSSCSTTETRRVNLVNKSVISHAWGKDRKVFTTSGTYPWSSVTQIFHNSHPSHGGDRKTLEIKVITKLPNSEQSYKGKVKTHNWWLQLNQDRATRTPPKNGGELRFQLIKSNIKNSMKNSVILKQ